MSEPFMEEYVGHSTEVDTSPSPSNETDISRQVHHTPLDAGAMMSADPTYNDDGTQKLLDKLAQFADPPVDTSAAHANKQTEASTPQERLEQINKELRELIIGYGVLEKDIQLEDSQEDELTIAELQLQLAKKRACQKAAQIFGFTVTHDTDSGAELGDEDYGRKLEIYKVLIRDRLRELRDGDFYIPKFNPWTGAEFPADCLEQYIIAGDNDDFIRDIGEHTLHKIEDNNLEAARLSGLFGVAVPEKVFSTKSGREIKYNPYEESSVRLSVVASRGIARAKEIVSPFHHIANFDTQTGQPLLPQEQALEYAYFIKKEIEDVGQRNIFVPTTSENGEEYVSNSLNQLIAAKRGTSREHYLREKGEEVLVAPPPESALRGDIAQFADVKRYVDKFPVDEGVESQWIALEKERYSVLKKLDCLTVALAQPDTRNEALYVVGRLLGFAHTYEGGKELHQKVQDAVSANIDHLVQELPQMPPDDAMRSLHIIAAVVHDDYENKMNVPAIEAIEQNMDLVEERLRVAIADKDTYAIRHWVQTLISVCQYGAAEPMEHAKQILDRCFFGPSEEMRVADAGTRLETVQGMVENGTIFRRDQLNPFAVGLCKKLLKSMGLILTNILMIALKRNVTAQRDIMGPECIEELLKFSSKLASWKSVNLEEQCCLIHFILNQSTDLIIL